MVIWLVEHGAADVTLVTTSGQTIWDCFGDFFFDPPENQINNEAAPNMMLFRAMLLKAAPPDELVAQFCPAKARLVAEGAQLRARLPAYVTQRRACLDAHCPLVAPLQAIVTGYEEPSTTEELWATGLGAAP